MVSHSGKGITTNATTQCRRQLICGSECFSFKIIFWLALPLLLNFMLTRRSGKKTCIFMFVYISTSITLLCIEFKLSLIFAGIYFLVAFTQAKPFLCTLATALLGIQTTGGFPLGVLPLMMLYNRFDVEYITYTLSFLSVTDVLIELYATNGLLAQAN